MIHSTSFLSSPILKWGSNRLVKKNVIGSVGLNCTFTGFDAATALEGLYACEHETEDWDKSLKCICGTNVT